MFLFNWPKPGNTYLAEPIHAELWHAEPLHAEPLHAESWYFRGLRCLAMIGAAFAIVIVPGVTVVGSIIGYPNYSTAVVGELLLLTAYFAAFCSCNLVWILPRRLEHRSFYWCNLAPFSFIILPLFS